MNESRVKGIVTLVGVIATFSLMKFLYIQQPIGNYISGWVLANVVIATLAFLFGAIVGSIVGAVSELIIIIDYRFSSLWSILFILLPCLYGFIIGKIFENKTIKSDNKNAIKGIGLFSLLSVGLFIVTQILTPIINRFMYLRSLPLFGFIRGQILLILINSLIVGVISFLLVLFYHKILKLCIPFFPNYKYSGNKEGEELAGKGLQLMLSKEWKEAVSYYEKAAELGHMGAQYALGEYYSDVNRNGNKAVYWYKRAAEQGHGDAQYNLAVLYQHGDIIGCNKTKAKYWFKRAIKQRNEAALNYESKLINNLTGIGEVCRDPTLIVLSILVGIILGGIMASRFGFIGFIIGTIIGFILVKIMRLRL